MSMNVRRTQLILQCTRTAALTYAAVSMLTFDAAADLGVSVTGLRLGSPTERSTGTAGRAWLQFFGN